MPAPSSEFLGHWPISPAAWQLVLALLALASPLPVKPFICEISVPCLCNGGYLLQVFLPDVKLPETMYLIF